jgi:hypothetical protein
VSVRGVARDRRVRVAILALIAVAVAACGSSGSSRGSATTSTTTSPCARFGDTSDRSGTAVDDPNRPAALLSNVQVQVSECVDEISFLFLGSERPAWNVTYVEPPFTADPSDMPVDVAGRAFLRVRFEPASGVDLSSDEPHEIYDGPTTIRPRPPSEVKEVVRLGDFEAVTTWVVGLPATRSFEVVLREEQLVLRVAAPHPRRARCALPGSPLTLGFPRTWFVEMSDRWACQYFHPDPFVVHPSTNDLPWLVTARVADAPAATVLARMAQDDSEIVSSSTDVAGFAATQLDVTASGNGLLPAGWRFRMYVVDTGAHAVTFMSAAAPDQARIARNLDAIDAIAALATAPS